MYGRDQFFLGLLGSTPEESYAVRHDKEEKPRGPVGRN